MTGLFPDLSPGRFEVHVPVFIHRTAPLPLRAACSMEGECKLVCLLACMMAEPFPDCLRYDILLRPWFAPLDLSFHRRTRQILN